MITVRAITAITLLAMVGLSYARPGSLEINQACVASGCFAGDSSGFPVTISASGSYVLTSNLETGELTTTGIQVLADNVYLDLAGFGVYGTNVCTGELGGCSDQDSRTGTGIGASLQKNVVIVDGIVSGFAFAGVVVGSKSRVDGVHALNNTRVGIRALDESTVINSLANFNSELGFETPDSLLINSTASNNGQYGASVGRGTVRDCVIRKNGSGGGSGAAGIYDFFGARIIDSQIAENSVGIVSQNGGTFISGAVIRQNEGLGIVAFGTTTVASPAPAVVLERNNIFLNNGDNVGAQYGGGGDVIELLPNQCGNDTTCR